MPNDLFGRFDDLQTFNNSIIVESGGGNLLLDGNFINLRWSNTVLAN